MTKNNLSTRYEKRIKIQTLVKEGFSLTDISEKVGVSINTASTWKNRDSIVDKKRSGRPTKLSPTTKNMIKSRLYRKSGSSVRKYAASLNNSDRFLRNGKRISYSAIQKHIKKTDWGKNAYKRTKKPFLSAKNIKDRVNFGNMLEREGYLTDGPRGEEKRRNILFTDETWIYLSPHVNAQNTRYRTENISEVPPIKKSGSDIKVMVAAGFSGRGVTKMYTLPKNTNMNSKNYRKEVLPIYFDAMDNKNIFPLKNKVTFMQDGAPPHSSKENLSFIKSKTSTFWGKGTWPGNIPDLNPLWNDLKNSAYADPVPTNREELIRRFENYWKRIPLDRLETLSQSFKSRVEKMMEANGGLKKY